jgi:hypothetical protein
LNSGRWLLLLSIVVLSASAQASDADFRINPPFGGGGFNVHMTVIDGVQIDVIAWNDFFRPLWWDATDGYGIMDGAENDEIDSRDHEELRIRFSQPVIIESILITDLFLLENPADEEWGRYSVDGINWLLFQQNAIHPNGELLITGIGLETTRLYFSALPDGGPEGGHFSVAKIVFSRGDAPADEASWGSVKSTWRP